ncbi:MAG: type II toxin-antitoxin system Phd/YefM family antitoxin, partial [Desulfobacterales bacterium]
MQRLKIDEDIKPLSEVRTGIAAFIKQVHDTKRPLIITQHGKGV